MKKPSLCILVDWFLPGYRAGGPIKSVANLVRALHDRLDISIITTDRDFGSNQPYENIEPNTWTRWENKASVFYFSPEGLSQARMEELLKEKNPDWIHLNSMFSVPFTVWPLRLLKKGKISAQVLLAPRGMLHPGALSLKKAKKKVFLSAAKLSGLVKNVIFHATDQEEINDIRRQFGDSVKIRLASNLPELEVPEWQNRIKKPGFLRLVFLSRISEKKNLHYLLERLKGMEGMILLDLYGPVEDAGYREKLDYLIAQLGENIAVEFKGAIPQPEVSDVLQNYHAFVMPTLGENFGHAIFEAMACGLPVLISDQTPWRNLEAKKAGWDLSLNQPEKFEKVLQNLLDMDQVIYETWSLKSWRYAYSYTQQPELRSVQLALFDLEP